MIRQHQLNAAVNDLHSAVELTRSQAMARGGRVIMAPAGADANGRSGNETPLTAAAQAGCDESVRLLLSRGADRSAGGPFGLSALEWAEARGFDHVAKILRADD